MKRYSEYKDSGVEWIGEIPSHWEVKKLKYLLDMIVDNRGKTPPIEDSGIPLLEIDSLEGENYNPSLKNVSKFISKKTYETFLRKYLDEGDILFATVGSIGKIAIVPSKFDYCIAQNIVGFRVNKINNIPRYWMYTMMSEYFKKMMMNYNKGNIQDSIKISDLVMGNVIVPSKKEQHSIASFLDKKTSQIENLISKKEELIETLKVSRTKLISETVTKGLDKNIPMKDSGVEWIGDIPSHYNIKKLRYLGTLQNGISKGAEEFGFGYPFVSYGDVYKNINISNKVEGLVNSSKEDRRIYSVIEGDVFFTRTSETIEEIGFASTCLNTIQDATFAGFLIRFRPNTNELYKGYSKYYFRSNIHRKFFVKEMNLVTRASLGQNLLKNLPVVIPSYEEQIEISNYLDKQVTIIDNSIVKIQEQIEVLKKAKKKLITEVVTGKIDVTNL